MQHSIADLTKTVVNLFGNSGAGKGVAIAEIGKECIKNGVTLRVYSSGEGFRALGSIPNPNEDVKEALELMRSGAQVEGIYPIEDSAVARIKEHLVAIQDDEESLLCLDGMWRDAEDVSSLTPGKRLPSQGLQLAGMFLRAIRELKSEGKLELTPEDSEVIDATSLQDLKTIDNDNLGITRIYDSLRRDSNHVLVYADNETARTLMRTRSFFELGKMALGLEEIVTDNPKRDIALDAVNQLVLIQSGNFEVKKDKLELKIDDLNFETQPFTPFTAEMDRLSDAEIQSLCYKGLVGLIGEDAVRKIPREKIIEKFIRQIKTDFNIKNDLRADDMTSEVRETRVEGFVSKVEGKVYPELGVRIVAEEDRAPELISEGTAQNISLLVNKIDRENPKRGFEVYVAQATVEAGRLFNRLGYRDETNGETLTGMNRNF